MASSFPNGLDAFVPILDGYHPIVTEDLNERLETIERIQQCLGWGSQGGSVGPKGASATVAARLDLMFEKNGGLNDVAFVTGTCALGRFSEDFLAEPNPKIQGLYIPFGKTISGGTMSSGGYAVLFSSFIKNGGGDKHFPGMWYVVNRDPEGVTIGSKMPYGPSRGYIAKSEETQITYSVLAIGPQAAVMI